MEKNCGNCDYNGIDLCSPECIDKSHWSPGKNYYIAQVEDLKSQLAIYKEAFLSTKEVKDFMVMPRSYYDDDWSDEHEAKYNNAKRRYDEALKLLPEGN